MNKKLIWTILILLTVGAITYAALHFFKGSTKHLRIIPKDAFFIAKIDFKSIFYKLDYDGEFKKTKFYKTLEKNSKELGNDKDGNIMKEIFENPMSTGINVFSQTYMFNLMQEGIDYTGFVADIRDKGNFNRTVEKIPTLKGKIKKTKDFYFVKFGRNVVMAWNDLGLLVLSATGWRMQDDETESVEVIANEMMLHTDSSSVLMIPEFDAFKDRSSDVDLFVNYGALFRNIKHNKLETNSTELMKRFDKVFFTASLDFMEDSLHVAFDVIGDQKQIDEFNYMSDKPLSLEALQLPNKISPLGIFSLHVDVLKFNELLKQYGTDINSEMNKRPDAKNWDITKIFDGQFTAVLLDVKTEKQERYDYIVDEASGNYNLKKEFVEVPVPIIGAFIGMKDKSVLTDLLVDFKFETYKNQKRFLISPQDSTYFYLIESKNGYYICQDEDMAFKMETMLQNPKPLSNLPMKTAQSHPMYFFFDLELEHYPRSVSDLFQKQMGNSGFKQLKEYMAFFKNAEFKGNINHSTFNVHFKHAEGNVLLRIFKQMDCINAFK